MAKPNDPRRSSGNPTVYREGDPNFLPPGSDLRAPLPNVPAMPEGFDASGRPLQGTRADLRQIPRTEARAILDQADAARRAGNTAERAGAGLVGPNRQLWRGQQPTVQMNQALAEELARQRFANPLANAEARGGDQLARMQNRVANVVERAPAQMMRHGDVLKPIIPGSDQRPPGLTDQEWSVLRQKMAAQDPSYRVGKQVMTGQQLADQFGVTTTPQGGLMNNRVRRP